MASDRPSVLDVWEERGPLYKWLRLLLRNGQRILDTISAVLDDHDVLGLVDHGAYVQQQLGIGRRPTDLPVVTPAEPVPVQAPVRSATPKVEDVLKRRVRPPDSPTDAIRNRRVAGAPDDRVKSKGGAKEG